MFALSAAIRSHQATGFWPVGVGCAIRAILASRMARAINRCAPFRNAKRGATVFLFPPAGLVPGWRGGLGELLSAVCSARLWLSSFWQVVFERFELNVSLVHLEVNHPCAEEVHPGRHHSVVYCH